MTTFVTTAARKKRQKQQAASSEEEEDTVPKETQPVKEPVKQRKSRLVRWCNAIIDFLNSLALQTVLYLVFVVIFQNLVTTMRRREEYYMDKVRGIASAAARMRTCRTCASDEGVHAVS